MSNSTSSTEGVSQAQNTHTPDEQLEVTQQELSQLMRMATNVSVLSGTFGPGGFFIRADLSPWAAQYIKESRADLATKR